nr:MAG: TIGR02281 family clan AA aspartic protease [Pseudomonadota bacterium]
MRHVHSIAWLVLSLAAGPAMATTVNLVGKLGTKALVSIDGGKPRLLAVGERAAEGVVLRAFDGQQATFEIDGQLHRVNMGQHYSPPDAPGGATLVLHADSQGHFLAHGTVNGAAIKFLVDTGATLVTLSAADAKRIGIRYHDAPRGYVSTANGSAAAYRVKFDTVRVGNISLHNVDGVVLESAMPYALLGMSFLNRMEMSRDGATMTLRRRY